MLKDIHQIVRNALIENVNLPISGPNYDLLAAYVMSTHISYYESQIANLQLLGVPGTGKTVILRALHNLVRNPVLVPAGQTLAAVEHRICQVPFPCTVLLDGATDEYSPLFNDFHGVPIIFSTVREIPSAKLKAWRAHSCFLLRLETGKFIPPPLKDEWIQAKQAIRDWEKPQGNVALSQRGMVDLILQAVRNA